MRKKLEFTIKILIAATFFVPLILVPENYIFPFIVPKILWLRSLVLLMLGGYILLLASNWQEYKTRLTPINIAVGLFFVSFTVSTFVGVDWYKSFWDNHERMLGLFTLFHYVIYYFVVTAVIKDWRDWKWLLRIFLFAGMIVMIIGGLQKLSPDLLLNRGSDRVSATLGNAIYFSGYGLFLFFIGLLLVAKERGEILRLRSGQVFWFWYAVLGGLLGLFGIFWGGTKGTLLGLITAGLALLVGYLLTIKEAKKIRLTLAVLLLLGLVVLGLLFIFRKNQTVSAIPVLGTLLNSSFSSGTGQTRGMAWQIALEAAKEKPVFGWGPNNYYFAFNKYYRPEFLEHGWGETWFDNAHSAIFNTLAVQGLVGLLAYAALFVVAVFCLWRAWKNSTIDKHVFVISLAFLVGHFVHNSTVFENPTSYLYFFFFLAFVNSQSGYIGNPCLIGRQADLRISKSVDKNISLGLGSVVFFVVLIFIYFTDINPALANKSVLETIKSIYSQPLLAGDNFSRVIKIGSPHVDDIRNDFAKAVTEAVPQFIQNQATDTLKKLFELSADELEKNKKLHPLDIRTHLQLAQQYSYYAQVFNQLEYLRKAEENLELALAISPRRQVIVYMLSFTKLQLGKPQAAIDLMVKAVEDDPKIAESWARLAFIYNQAGDTVKAKALIEEATGQGVVFSGQSQGIVDLIFNTSTNK